jgi:phosphoketolase
MAKKKTKNVRPYGYKPKTINVQPFDDQNTDDARGKAIDEIIKEFQKDIRKEQFFKNPKYPRA